MHSAAADLSETYRVLPDKEIAALFADINSLTNEARSALLNEIQQRGLTEPQLQKLHAIERRREGHFDRMESIRRKRMVLSSFDLVDLKGWIFALFLVLALILVSELIFHHH